MSEIPDPNEPVFENEENTPTEPEYTTTPGSGYEPEYEPEYDPEPTNTKSWIAIVIGAVAGGLAVVALLIGFGAKDAANDNTSIEATRDEVARQFDAKESQLREAEASVNESNEALNKKIKTNANEINDLNKRIKKLNNTTDNTNNELATANKKIASLNSEVVTLNKRIDSLQDRLKSEDN